MTRGRECVGQDLRVCIWYGGAEQGAQEVYEAEGVWGRGQSKGLRRYMGQRVCGAGAEQGAQEVYGAEGVWGRRQSKGLRRYMGQRVCGAGGRARGSGGIWGRGCVGQGAEQGAQEVYGAEGQKQAWNNAAWVFNAFPSRESSAGT
ncbi:unnamed protein product [Eretmochelys imbricata]